MNEIESSFISAFLLFFRHMILFLDDDKRRTAYFRNLCEVPSFAVETAEDAIKALGTNHFTHIFLDHDLGGEVYVNSNRKDCGMEVVRWMCACGPEEIGNPEVIVHSYNEDAASDMVSKLVLAGYKVHRLRFSTSVFNQFVLALH